MGLDWNTAIINLVGGLATAVPMILVFYFSSRGGFAEAAEKAGRSLGDLWKLVEELQDESRKNKKNMQVLFSYLLANLEVMVKRGVHPVQPPEEFKTDPEIMAIMQKMMRKKKRSK